MQYGMMLIGTVLIVLFVLQMMRGQQYEEWIEGLNDKEYPIKAIYVVGFSWMNVPMFALKGRMKEELKKQSGLIYGTVYCDYYANVVWAQFLSFINLFLAMAFIYGAWQKSLKSLAIGLFFVLIVGVYSLTNMKNRISKRMGDCEAELPEAVSTMAILVNSGMVLRDAWNMIAKKGSGVFYELMRDATENMKNGYSDADAILLFGKSTNSMEIIKFTGALLQSIEKGGGELPVFLARESSELWNSKRQKMLQQGEKASAKLLVPILLIFAGIIIIIMTAALAGALFQ
jgi:hypothetical protein